jgi:hypothetical protein
LFVFHEGPKTTLFVKFPYGYWIESNTETKSFLFSVIRSHKDPQIFSIYNKSTGLIKISKRKSYNYVNDKIFMKNDLDKVVAFPAMNLFGRLYYYNECLYAILDAKDFLKSYNSVTPEVQNSSDYLKNMTHVFRTITEFSNPVIMKVYLK